MSSPVVPDTRRIVLLWLERALLAIGVALGVWCAVILIEAHRYSTMSIPTPAAARPATLPGDDAVSSAPRHPAVATGEWVARLEAPSVHLSATVLEGTDDATLGKAAGHIEDTAFPGDPGNVGIAGHRDTTFRAVRNLHAGDPLVVTTRDYTYRYRVSQTHVVNPEDVYVLDPTDHPAVTLVTCYPFEFIGHAPRRFIVRADLIAEEKR
jgi:sortase A